jgi:hypothetical protein
MENVIYINFQDADHNLETLKNYAQLSMDFCKNHEHTCWINFTNCMKITGHMDRQIKVVEDLKLLVRQLTRAEDRALVLQKRSFQFYRWNK